MTFVGRSESVAFAFGRVSGGENGQVVESRDHDVLSGSRQRNVTKHKVAGKGIRAIESVAGAGASRRDGLLWEYHEWAGQLVLNHLSIEPGSAQASVM